MEIKQTKHGKTPVPMYYTEVGIRDFSSNLAATTLVVDTGACVTYIPEAAMEQISPRECKGSLMRFPNGKIVRAKRWLIGIEIDGEVYWPKGGVAVTPNEIGYLGLDILSEMDMLICGGVMVLEGRVNDE